MSFYFFNQNAFSTIQNHQFFQNYHPQEHYFISAPTQPYYEFITWNHQVQPQNCFIPQKALELVHFQTNQSYSESSMIVDVPNKEKKPKRRQNRTAQKEIISAKKNSQSNIINQFYSFFSSRDKSQNIAIKAIKATMPDAANKQKILILFYNTITAININRGRKYVNRSMILNYFTSEIMIENLPEIQQKLKSHDFITLDELCQVFRRCCYAFFKIVSTPALLTSKRITGISKEQHLRKRRKVLKLITGY